MRRSYPTRETVYQIDAGDYKDYYVFPRYLAGGQIFQSPDGVIVGAITGNGSPLILIRVGTDRLGEAVRANADRIPGYREVVLKVPSDILTLVEEFNSLSTSASEASSKEEPISEEDKDRLDELDAKLTKYFKK